MLPELQKYPFDPTAVASTNAVSGEIITLDTVSNQIIVPTYTPFYAQGFSLAPVGGNPLVPGDDYKLVYLYQEATMDTGHEVVTAIALLNDNLTVDELVLSYQTVGERYASEAAAIHEVLTTLNVSDLTVHWDDIKNKKEEYPPEDHKHSGYDLVGLSELVESIGNVKDAIDISNEAFVEQILKQLAKKTSDVGRTKLITQDEAAFLPGDYVGPLRLLVERSIDQNAINVIEFEIVSPKGVARYSLSYKEIEHDNVSVYLHGSELSGERIKYYFEYFDATRNALYIELDDNEQNWDESHLCVTRMTTSCLSGERYRTGWLWGKNPDLTDKEMRSAESETKNLLVEIEEVNTEWRNYVDRPESF